MALVNKQQFAAENKKQCREIGEKDLDYILSDFFRLAEDGSGHDLRYPYLK